MKYNKVLELVLTFVIANVALLLGYPYGIILIAAAMYVIAIVSVVREYSTKRKSNE
jgi:hypothetical protein